MPKKKFPVLTDEELDRLQHGAWNGILDFSAFPAEEYKFFDTVQNIGYRYRQEKYPIDFCKEDIINARQEYKEEIAERGSRAEIYRKYQEAIRRSDELRCRINKAQNADEALRLALECIELMTGEEGFMLRVLKYLGIGEKP